jgi:hypothetical protein
MPGYIEFKDDNGTYRITRENPPVQLHEVMEEMVFPLLLAAGYSKTTINEYFVEDTDVDKS